MNTFISIGTKVVVLALVSYSIAIITEQRKRHITNYVLIFITAGIVLDIAATLFMIMGSTSETIFTLHGFIGYSSLAGMLTDAVFMWKFRLKNGYATLRQNLK